MNKNEKNCNTNTCGDSMRTNGDDFGRGGASRTITAEQLLSLIQSDKPVKVVNVLDENHYNERHIVRSISVPLAELEKRSRSWKKDERIVVYCASRECPLSKQALDLLLSLGFTNVSAYEGGIAEWEQKKYSVEGTAYNN